MSAADPTFLIDSNLTTWTLVSSAANGLRVSKAGVTDTTTSNVVLLLYYKSIIYYQNSSGSWAAYNGTSWVSLSADPRITSPSVGPTAAGTVKADFSSLTVDSVARELFGVSTASMVDNNFVLCNNLSFQVASKAFDPPLLRFNCNAGGSGGNTTLNSFPNGPAGGINAAVYAPLINNLNKIVNLSTTKIVMCFGGGNTGLGPTNGWTVAEFASAFSQTVQLFRNTAGSDGRPIDPIYWEIGNEVESFLSNAVYATYFNACAAAAHAIDSKYILCGPVAIPLASQDSVPLDVGPGPAAVGTLATADFAVTTGANALTTDSTCFNNGSNVASYPHSGQFIWRTVWGVASGALAGNNAGAGGFGDNPFIPLTYPSMRTALQKVPWAFFRWNASTLESCVGIGGAGSTATPDFSTFDNLLANAASVFPSYCQTTFGLGINPSVTWSTSDYDSIVRKYVTYLHNNWPAAAGTILGWEVGNENVGDGGGGVSQGTYDTYFNVAADAVHALYPNDLMLGPVATDENLGVASTFASDCAARYGVYDHHAYGNNDTLFSGGNPQNAQGLNNVGSDSRSYQAAVSIRSTIGGSKPIMVGEWAGNATPLGSDGWMTQNAGAAFAAVWCMGSLNANKGVQYMNIWEAMQDTNYGQVSPNGGGPISDPTPIPSTGTLRVVPSAYFLSKAGQVLYGNRVRCTLVSAGSAKVMLLAVTGGGGVANFAVGVFNYSTTSVTGSLGLSHWPVNSTGNGVMKVHTVSSAQNDGLTPPATTTTTVSAGVTGSITFPAQSTVIVYNDSSVSPLDVSASAEVAALISAAGSSRLGLPDQHAYLYKPGVDGVPSDLQAAQAILATTGTTPATLANGINATVAGTFAANLPYFVGQYNLAGGSSSSFNGLFGPNDATGRDQNLIGALFLTSWLFKLQVAVNPTLWAGYWEYGTSSYGLFTGTFSKTPPGAILSSLGHNAPGTVVTVTNGTSLEAWATVNGPTFCMILVNPTTSPLTQSVGLSHWSLNTTGTANINRFEVSQANLGGIETAVAVTAGVLTVTVPGQSIVLLYP